MLKKLTTDGSESQLFIDILNEILWFQWVRMLGYQVLKSGIEPSLPPAATFAFLFTFGSWSRTQTDAAAAWISAYYQRASLSYDLYIDPFKDRQANARRLVLIGPVRT